MSAAFVPGPWSRDKYGHIVDASGADVRFRSVTILSTGPEASIQQAEANTDLAAAAPELLAALQAVLGHFDVVSYEVAFGLAAKAIAKATGSAS